MTTATAERHAEFNPRRLFVLSTIALATTAFVFSLRASATSGISQALFTGAAAKSSEQLTGLILGAAFWGFAVAIIIGSPLCDFVGMRNLLSLACALHIGGTIVAILIPPGPHAGAILWGAVFVTGLGNGLIEAVINPLTATIYSDDKTHHLNLLHAWWPGGLILGGLLGFLLTRLGATWQVQLGFVLVPAVIYGAMLIGAKFPPTERVAAGVSAGAMFMEAIRPLFLMLMCCMLITASCELAVGQWVDAMLTRVIGFQGILLIVYVSAWQFVGRHFAGTFAHRLSPIGLMWVSCLLTATGLMLFSFAHNPVTGLAAATVWAFGVCFMWPTMLGISAERFPKGGAFVIGLMGAVGNAGTGATIPLIGRVFDHWKGVFARGTEYHSFQALNAAASVPGAQHAQQVMNDVLVKAARPAFQFVAMLPIALLFVFGVWWLIDKSRGGYKAVKLTPVDAAK